MKKGIKYIQNFFNNCLKKNGSTFELVGWKSRESQMLRFSILSEISDLNGCTILDVGCGLGDFYKYLTSKYRIKDYLGVDINNKMILNARKSIPNVKFEVKNLLRDQVEENFDYVFESGIFNLFIDNWEESTYSILFKMFSLCKKGMGINFLSSLTAFNKDIKCYYTCPMKMCKFVTDNLSRKFVMRHDYKVNDVSFFVYKEEKK